MPPHRLLRSLHLLSLSVGPASAPHTLPQFKVPASHCPWLPAHECRHPHLQTLRKKDSVPADTDRSGAEPDVCHQHPVRTPIHPEQECVLRNGGDVGEHGLHHHFHPVLRP